MVKVLRHMCDGNDDMLRKFQSSVRMVLIQEANRAEGHRPGTRERLNQAFARQHKKDRELGRY